MASRLRNFGDSLPLSSTRGNHTSVSILVARSVPSGPARVHRIARTRSHLTGSLSDRGSEALWATANERSITESFQSRDQCSPAAQDHRTPESVASLENYNNETVYFSSPEAPSFDASLLHVDQLAHSFGVLPVATQDPLLYQGTDDPNMNAFDFILPSKFDQMDPYMSHYQSQHYVGGPYPTSEPPRSSSTTSRTSAAMAHAYAGAPPMITSNPASPDPRCLSSREGSQPYSGLSSPYQAAQPSPPTSYSSLGYAQTVHPSITSSPAPAYSNLASQIPETSQYGTAAANSSSGYGAPSYSSGYGGVPSPQPFYTPQSVINPGSPASIPASYLASVGDQNPSTTTSGDEPVRILHSRPKPQCWDHGCNGRQFSTFSNLLRHQREKSGTATKSNCPRCGAEFTRTTARNGHMANEKCKRRRKSGSDVDEE